MTVATIEVKRDPRDDRAVLLFLRSLADDRGILPPADSRSYRARQWCARHSYAFFTGDKRGRHRGWEITGMGHEHLKWLERGSAP